MPKLTCFQIFDCSEITSPTKLSKTWHRTCSLIIIGLYQFGGGCWRQNGEVLIQSSGRVQIGPSAKSS